MSTSQWKTSDNFMADRQVGTAKPGDGKGRIYLFFSFWLPQLLSSQYTSDSH